MNNIFIDEQIQNDVNENRNNFHSISLNVAQLNLEDYNRRFETNFDLDYTKNDRGQFNFSLANPPQYPLDHRIDSDINFFRSWALNYVDKRWFENYYHNVKSLEYDQIALWRTIDRDMYLDKAKSFVTKYTDYSPLGFLSDEESQSVKSEISNRFLRLL